MDRITVALSATEDNAAAIRELGKALAKQASCKFLLGTTDEDGSTTKFGQVVSNGNALAIITFSGSSVAVGFCGRRITLSSSPVMVFLPAGSGELMLGAVRTNARALVIAQ